MNEDVKKVVARILKDIQVEMSDEFDKNFERQAFFSEKWQRRKSPIRDEGRAILTDTGALRKSIGSRTTENSITFFTTLPYAAIHNDGGEIVVTGRMKRFFWHKYYEATGAFGRRKDGRLRKDKRNARLDTEADFWMLVLGIGRLLDVERLCTAVADFFALLSLLLLHVEVFVDDVVHID